MIKVHRILIVLLLCVMTSILSETCLCANPVTTNDSDVDIIVKPLAKANWNFYGVVPDLESLGAVGVAYYNKYLSPAWDMWNQVILEDKRAMLGCLNWGLGVVMHTLKYPNSISCDNKLDVRKTFYIREKPNIINGEFINDISVPKPRRFQIPNLYNWEIMATNPGYEYAKTLNLDVYIASRDEVVELSIVIYS